MANVMEAVDLDSPNLDEQKEAILQELANYDKCRAGVPNGSSTTILAQHGQRWYHVVKLRGKSKAATYSLACSLIAEARVRQEEQRQMKLARSAKLTAIRQHANAKRKPTAPYYQPRNRI